MTKEQPMRIGFYLRAGVLFGVTAILASSAAHARPHHHGLHAAHLMRPEVSASPANHVAPTGTLKPEDHGVADTDDAFTKAGRNAGRPDQPDPAKTGSDGTLGMIKGEHRRVRKGRKAIRRTHEGSRPSRYWHLSGGALATHETRHSSERKDQI
jgi:hypothetical protein